MGLVEEARLACSLPPPVERAEIRRRAHISRQRLADELGCHVISVARWERGTRNPHGDLRLAYARLLRLLDEVSPRGQ